jgi:hypothetical protein
MLVRIPLDLVLGVPFPLGGDHYDIAASGPAVETTLKVLAHRSLALGKQRLSRAFEAPPASWLCSRTLVRRLRSGGRAVAEPLAQDIAIPFSWAIWTPISSIRSARPNSIFDRDGLAADLGDYTELTIAISPLGEAARAMVITGGSRPRDATQPASIRLGTSIFGNCMRIEL